MILNAIVLSGEVQESVFYDQMTHNGPHCQDTNPGQSKVSYLFNSSHLLCKRER
jgi:hypothetical protein